MAEALIHNLKLIGRYALLQELRRERYTAAYLARDPVLNREVVLKAVQLRPAPGQDAAGHDRMDQAFMRQAQAAGRLHHPHMVTVFDAGRVHNVGYLVLERIEGRLLGEALAQGWQPGPLEAADIVARVADAVEYAHARGIPHGHLGGSRIYLQGTERVPRVMGFGGWIDTGITGDFELAATESTLPYYESELGEEARRRDLRSLGALLFLLLTGTRPDLKTLRARRSTESAILEQRPLAPSALADIADAALELRSLPPYATAAQMRNALTTWLWGNAETRTLPTGLTVTGIHARNEVTRARTPATVARPASSGPREAAPPTLRRRTVVAGCTIAAVTGLVGALVQWPDKPDLPAPRPAVVAQTPAPATPTVPPASRTAAQTTHFGPSGVRPPAAPSQAPTAVEGMQPTPRFQ